MIEVVIEVSIEMKEYVLYVLWMLWKMSIIFSWPVIKQKYSFFKGNILLLRYVKHLGEGSSIITANSKIPDLTYLFIHFW